MMNHAHCLILCESVPLCSVNCVTLLVYWQVPALLRSCAATCHFRVANNWRHVRLHAMSAGRRGHGVSHHFPPSHQTHVATHQVLGGAVRVTSPVWREWQLHQRCAEGERPLAEGDISGLGVGRSPLQTQPWRHIDSAVCFPCGGARAAERRHLSCWSVHSRPACYGDARPGRSPEGGLRCNAPRGPVKQRDAGPTFSASRISSWSCSPWS